MFYFQMFLILISLCLATRAIQMLRRILDRHDDSTKHLRLAAYLVILAALAVGGCQMTFAFKSPGTNPTQDLSPNVDTTHPLPQEHPDEGPIQPAH